MGGLRFGDGVHVRQLGGRGAPTSFIWRGRQHVVCSVESSRPAGSPGSAGRLFRLRTDSGMRCEVLFDAARGTWRLERVLASRGGRSERRNALV